MSTLTSALDIICIATTSDFNSAGEGKCNVTKKASFWIKVSFPTSQRKYSHQMTGLSFTRLHSSASIHVFFYLCVLIPWLFAFLRVTCCYLSTHFPVFLKSFICLFFLERGEWREEEEKGNIDVREEHQSVASLMCPNLACALTWNQTGKLLLCDMMSNSLSHTDQGTILMSVLIPTPSNKYLNIITYLY